MSFVNTVDLIGDEALSASIIGRSITEIADNTVTAVGEYAFNNCRALKTAKFAAAMSLGELAFSWCIAMKSADFYMVSSIQGRNALQNCSELIALILRGAAVCTVQYVNTFSGTPIASGKGYIYVPAALVNTYKAATNWSAYAAQFRALEDYTVDGTITGELDESKI